METMVYRLLCLTIVLSFHGLIQLLVIYGNIFTCFFSLLKDLVMHHLHLMLLKLLLKFHSFCALTPKFIVQGIAISCFFTCFFFCGEGKRGEGGEERGEYPCYAK